MYLNDDCIEFHVDIKQLTSNSSFSYSMFEELTFSSALPS